MLLKFLTFLTEQERNDLEKQHHETRIVQTKLAKEITHFVHGNEGLEQAETI
jgi:tyrosyl-tRNA synthetase